jgi:hypothetical protein
MAFGTGGVGRQWAASARVEQDAPREWASHVHTLVRPAQPWQKRGCHAQVCCGRTSPYGGQPPGVHASGEREVVSPWRRPLRKSPRPAAASTWRRAWAGSGGWPPRPCARAGTPDTPPRMRRALEPPWGSEAQAVERSPAARAASDTRRASPGGHGSRVIHNAQFLAVCRKSTLGGM